MIRICQQCKNEYKTSPSVKLQFCSIKCYGFSQRREVIKICQNCNKSFNVKNHRKKDAKYCSIKCTSIAIIPWNKGNHLRLNTGRTHFKKGENMENKHFRWKGDDVGYSALHDWVYSRLGSPDMCKFCGKSGLKGNQIHWANKSGRYLRELTDWIRLCIECHTAYDAKPINQV